MQFKCQHLRPEKSRVALIEAESAHEAAQDFHVRSPLGARLDDGTGARFSVIDVNGESVVSRVFIEGIFRYGGIKHQNTADSLVDVARMLRVDLDVLTGDWVGEEPVGVYTNTLQKLDWTD